jgi:hypothetical protein
LKDVDIIRPSFWLYFNNFAIPPRLYLEVSLDSETRWNSPCLTYLAIQAYLNKICLSQSARNAGLLLAFIIVIGVALAVNYYRTK